MESFARRVTPFGFKKPFSNKCSLVAEFVQHGSKMRHMEEFVHSVYSSSYVKADSLPLAYVLS